MSQQRRFYVALASLIHMGAWGAIEYIVDEFVRLRGDILADHLACLQDVPLSHAEILPFLLDPHLATMIIDPDGTILHIGTHMAAWYGRRADDLVGQSAWNLSDPAIGIHHRRECEEIVRTGQPGLTMHQTRDGRVVEVLGIPFSRGGCVCCVLVLARPMPMKRVFVQAFGSAEPRVIE